MKENSEIEGNFNSFYINVKRMNTGLLTNIGASSTVNDSVFSNVNFAFPNWPNAQSPCMLANNTNFNKLEKPINIFPNPTKGKLFIENLDGTETIVVKNILGQIQKCNVAGSILDATHLSKGIYIISFEKNNLRYTSKFLIE